MDGQRQVFDPAVITFKVACNTTEVWNLTSGGGWSHPVHIHHEEFQILSRNGKAPAADDISRKDVVRIGQAAEGTAGTGSLSFQMQFRDWYGDYPMHCHNVVHEDHSMMIRWEILKP